MKLILYSKPGCHLCEGLQEKLEQIQQNQSLALELELRDITTREEWWQAYQYEIPVLVADLPNSAVPLPRPSPRASIQQIERMLQKYLSEIGDRGTE